MKRLAPGLLVVASIAASGCGASAKSERQHFVARAVSICTHFSGLQNQVQFPSTNPVAAATTRVERAEWGVALKQVAYLGTQEVKELRKLHPPDALDARFDALLTTMESGYTRLLTAARAAEQDHVPALRDAVTAGRADLARGAAAAKRLGLRACA